MPITEETHPYRVQIADKIVAFPASMPLKQVESACKKIIDVQRNPKVVPAPKSQAKNKKSASILGADKMGTPSRADLDKALDDAGVPPHDDLAQRMISFRSRKSLPEKTKANIQKLYAAFNNSQVKPTPARKKSQRGLPRYA